MQTFLPLPSYPESARVLDPRRLGNQVNEALIVLRTLTGWYQRHRGTRGWIYHSTSRMWTGYEFSLGQYAFACLREWIERDVPKRIDQGKARFSRIADVLAEFREHTGGCKLIHPHWLGDERLHRSHRAVLLAKDLEWYGRLGWLEDPAVKGKDGRWPYYWPEGIGSGSGTEGEIGEQEEDKIPLDLLSTVWYDGCRLGAVGRPHSL